METKAPKTLDYNYGIVPSERARDGLRMLGEDISNYLNGKKQDIKTTESEAKIVNNIYNYGTRTPTTRFAFLNTAWIILWTVVLVVGVYIIITNPQSIVNFGNWLHSIFT